MPSSLPLLFLTFTLSDALDIFLVSILLYQVFKLVRGTAAINIFYGVLSFYLIYILVRAFDLRLLTTIFSRFIDVGIIAIIVVFQQELRRFLIMLGTNNIFNKKAWNVFRATRDINLTDEDLINQISDACFEMSKSKTGALLVMEQKNPLDYVIETGEKLKSEVTKSLLISIFYKNSPLHDGAVIIRDNKIIAARCILPVTDRTNIPSSYGMRHRAALGISENTDSIAITVSEQTGNIAIIQKGEIYKDLDKTKFNQIMNELFRE
jgi:diadenylate cyclase